MLEVKINGQKVEVVSDLIASESKDYLKVNFSFSKDWDGYAKTAVFRNANKEKTIGVILENNECMVPYEIIHENGFSISVYGLKGSSRITTTEGYVWVEKSGFSQETTEPASPTQTEYEQIISIMQENKKISDKLSADAESGKFKGEKGGIGPQGPKGETGLQGVQGERGSDGYTPQKGIDYFTEEDIKGLQIPEVDKSYSPNSENAQSGKAVAEAINNIKVNQNLINMNEGEIGFITVNGTVQHPIGKYNAEAEKTSGFISVEKGQKYTLQAWVETGSAGMWIAYAFYDSDKTFISRSTSTTVNEINNNISHSSVTFTVPENAAFVRISGRTYNNGEFKLEKGEAATPYVANFQEKIDKLDVEKSIPLTYTTIIPSIYTNELPSIDTKAKTLYIPADTLLIDKRLNGTVSLEKQTFSFTASSSAVCILYDIKNSTLYSAIYSQCAALNPNNYLLLFAIRTDVYNHGYGKVSSTCPVIVDGRLYGVIDIESANSNSNDNNPYIHSINHRGYNTVAPENTLSAFKLSKKNGFDYVETDINFTSDNIPVLLHDSTIDRTSNGSGNISEMTFEQVRTYDFGSWKNSVYAGEKIPSFEEFCKLCKQIGLKPYVELKTAPTNEQLTTLVNNAKRYGILNDITWISFVSSALEKVLTSLPKARVGIITSGLTQTTINWVKSKKTDANDVFIDENISSLSSDNVQLCIADNIPLEVWTVNTSAGIQNADNYITGFTSDNLIANKQLFDTTV